MPSLFVGGEQGSNAINVQQGAYLAEFDLATGSGNQPSFAYDSGDEILDLTDPQLPTAPMGVYIVTVNVWWDENETGAAVLAVLSLSGNPNFDAVADLGVVRPGIAGGGSFSISGADLFSADDLTIHMLIEHNRATDTLPGGVLMSVVRMY